MNHLSLFTLQPVNVKLSVKGPKLWARGRRRQEWGHGEDTNLTGGLSLEYLSVSQFCE